METSYSDDERGLDNDDSPVVDPVWPDNPFEGDPNEWVITKVSRIQQENSWLSAGSGDSYILGLSDSHKINPVDTSGEFPGPGNDGDEENVIEPSDQGNESRKDFVEPFVPTVMTSTEEASAPDVENVYGAILLEDRVPSEEVMRKDIVEAIVPTVLTSIAETSVPDEENVNGTTSIPLEDRVASSCSSGGKSNYTTQTDSTFAADNTTKLSQWEERNVTTSSNDEAEEDGDKEKAPSHRRHVIYCSLILAIVAGSTCFLVIGTGLHERFKRNETEEGPTTTPSDPTLTPAAPHDLLNILQSIAGGALNDVDSPQYQAYQWMLSDPISNAPSTNSERVQQRYALVTLYAALLEDIPSFASTDECSWPSTVCDKVNTSSLFEAKDWQITQLSLARQGLSGSIPSEIKLLSTSLVYLDLAENPSLRGSIPEELYELTNLKYLYLHDTAMDGTLAESIGNLQLLEDLFLGNSAFSGTIPHSLGSHQDESPFRKLILRKNKFEGTIPANMAWTNAVYVDLSFNNLRGTLPEEFGTIFTSLRQLYLDHNQFSGTIPQSYGMAGSGSLLTLFLNNNLLTGGLPTVWVDSDDKSAVPSIDTINVRNNNLTDSIDQNICKLGISNNGGSLMELTADCVICSCNELCSGCLGN